MTLPYAEVIGDPVSHSRSPAIHRFWLDRLGIEGDYRGTRVTAAGVGDYLNRRQEDPLWRGCNVTMPLKETVMSLLSSIDEGARRVGAVNTVSHERRGFNTDVIAVRSLLGRHSPDGPVRVIGTGGAARAALEGCRLAGFSPETITVHGRSGEKAQRLAELFLGSRDQAGPISPQALSGATIIVNASPLGMRGFPPLDIEPEGLVFDMVYDPLETDLLGAARRRGLPTIDGLDMLIEQAGAAFALFFGKHPPRDSDVELRGALAP